MNAGVNQPQSTPDVAGIPPGVPTVPAIKTDIPICYTNQVQLISLGNLVVLEFRAIIPDTLDSSFPNGQEVAVSANLREVPAHTRVILPVEVAKELEAMLKRSVVDVVRQ